MNERNTDHRISGGLNNQGFPLRKIVEVRGEQHVLECGHVLHRVSDSYVRARRCPECKGQKLRPAEMPKINGNARFTALHKGGGTTMILAFYEKPPDVTHFGQAVGAIEFESWEKYREFITLQTVLVRRLDRQMANDNEARLSGN